MTDHLMLYGLAVATNLVFQTNVDLFHRGIAHYGLVTPVPIRATELQQFSYSFEDHSFALILTNGWFLSYDYGKLTEFRNPVHLHPNRNLTDRADRILTEAEVVEVARNFARKTGLSDREMYLHLDPKISSMPQMPWYPFFEVEWQIPNEWMGVTFRCTVDCRDGSVVCATFVSLFEHLLREDVAKRRAQRGTIPVRAVSRPEPAVEDRLLANVCTQLRRWAPDGGYPTNWIEADAVRQKIRWDFLDSANPEKSWRAVVCYTNEQGGEWVFKFRASRLALWYPPDAFFAVDHPDIEDFVGRWRMSETQAADLVRRQVRKMDFPRAAVEFLRKKPTLIWKPRLVGTKYVVPRFDLLWQDGSGSEVHAEVDADARRIKLLAVDVPERSQ